MTWQQTYASFLRHEDYPENEITEWVGTANKTVNNMPEPYKSRLVRQLQSMSRDDFCVVEFELLKQIFEQHPLEKSPPLHRPKGD